MLNTLKNKHYLLTISAIALSTPAYAQVENATGIADPSRISQQLQKTETLPEISLEKTTKARAVQNNAPEGAQNVTFRLNTLKIEGVTTYNDTDIDALYRDLLGKTVSLSDIYSIATDLTNKYRNDGYILTQVVIPPQTIENGEVRLNVIEGFIDQIIIEGEPNQNARNRILSYAENIRGNNILDTKLLEHYLLLINDLPGVKARSVLSPSKTLTGASDLTIIVERDRYEAELSLNNQSSRFIGPYQGSYRGALNSAFGLNEEISGTFVIAGDKNRADELLFGAVSYEQPISDHGSTVRITGSITSTEPGADLDQFNVEGRSKFVSAVLSHPFIRSRSTNFLGRLGFDFRNVESKNDLETKREDRISSFRMGTTYQFIDTFIGIGVNAFDIEVSHGTGLFNASSRGQANLTRARGNSRYTKIKTQMQRLQRLIPKLNLLLAAQGQLSSSPLLSSEEFGVGGTDFGRGYDSSEIVGEDGFAAKAEIQWNTPKPLKYVDNYRLYAFIDGGRVFNQDATTSDDKRESLVSTGLGMHTNITKNTELELGIAFPLTRQVDARNDKDPRIFFNLTHKF